LAHAPGAMSALLDLIASATLPPLGLFIDPEDLTGSTWL
jgi:hypothetical protein